ncbi:hypothetical protein [Tepidibacillus marianensis]|uniref:hypothetical protein n=1 Tax=Tepidibacillus marianensis TaxID=3131995 RepID=UPI0030D60A87
MKFEIESKMENMRVCVNYVFEYFNQYLDLSKMDEKTALNNERIEKYRKQLHQYDPEIQNWLVGIYDDYNVQINRSIISILKKLSYFYCIILIANSEVFRMTVCYAKLIKKNTFLKDQNIKSSENKRGKYEYNY